VLAVGCSYWVHQDREVAIYDRITTQMIHDISMAGSSSDFPTASAVQWQVKNGRRAILQDQFVADLNNTRGDS